MIILRNKEYSSKTLQVYTKARTGFKKKPKIEELRKVVGEKNKAIYYAHNPKAAAVDASVEGLKKANELKETLNMAAANPGLAGERVGKWAAENPMTSLVKPIPIPGTSSMLFVEKPLKKYTKYGKFTEKLGKAYDEKNIGKKVNAATETLVNQLKWMS